MNRISTTSNEEEQLLARQCAAQERKAQSQFYQLYAGRLFTVCLRFMPSRAEAEDIFHDGMLIIFERLKQFTWQGNGSLLKWACQVMRNECLQKLRKASRFRIVSLDESLKEEGILGSEIEAHMASLQDDDIETALVQKIPMAKILQLISAMPDGYRIVLNLVLFDGLSHREAAKLMGINEKSSSSQYARAKRFLAQKIKQIISNEQND